LLATKTAAPYSYSWTGVAAGSYTITAKVYDNSTGTASASVSITVNASTGGTCTAAAWNSTIAYTAPMLVSYNNHTYQAKWWTQGEQPDTHTGVGLAWQDNGACSSGMTNQNPTVSFTSPGNGATFTAPASVSITANAADADGTVSKVEFYNGAALLATKTAAPYSYSWTGIVAGSYTITAKAYDNSTGTASTSVTITVKAATSGSCTAAAWNSTIAYTPPMTVSYGGHTYQAKWWTQGEQPDTHNGVGLAWQDNGVCGSARLAATSTINIETEKISPNPALDVQNVELTVESFIDGDQSLMIISSDGLIQRSENVSLLNGYNKLSINISELREGVYVIRVGQKVFKFIKQ